MQEGTWVTDDTPKDPVTPGIADGKGDGMVVVKLVMNENCRHSRGRAVCTLALM